MSESKCGVNCSNCMCRDAVNCKGCANMEKLFWGGDCKIKKCCNLKNLNCCGECKEFPCKTVTKMGMEKWCDPKAGLEKIKNEQKVIEI